MNNTEDKTASRRAEFSDALADEILARLTDGKSLSSICSDDGLPSYRTIMRRIGDDETFRERYELARRIQAERFADELVTIADDGRNDTYTDKDGNVQVDCDHIQRARLRVATRQWIISKILPRKYGDAPTSSLNVSTTNNFLVVTEAERLDMIEQRKRLQGFNDSSIIHG